MILSPLDYIKFGLSFQYISNLSILVILFAYYTNAYYIFFLMIPLLITNFIMVLLLLWFNYNEFISYIFNKKINQHTVLNTAVSSQVLTNDDIILFMFFTVLWHLIPLLWLYNVLHRDNLIVIFKPNFMEIFLIDIIIVLMYFYYGSRKLLYGDINYLWYGGIYILTLFIFCIVIFKSN